MESIFGIGTGAEIQVVLQDEDTRKTVEAKVDKDKKSKLPVYFDGESVIGKAQVRIKEGKRLEHQGIKGHCTDLRSDGLIQLNLLDSCSCSTIVEITLNSCRLHRNWLHQGNCVRARRLICITASPSEFKNVEKQFESYLGINVKLR
jgi:vacuolar protein sorting-associated protein 26